jgi:transcriptional regulator with XRE-family HTH domain
MVKSIKAEAYQAILPILASARREAGLTQAEVAARLGKPQSYISKVEQGERRLDVVEFCLLADAFGIEPGRLLQRIASQVLGST